MTVHDTTRWLTQITPTPPIISCWWLRQVPRFPGLSCLTTFLGTISLYVLMCRKAVNQSINHDFLNLACSELWCQWRVISHSLLQRVIHTYIHTYTVLIFRFIPSKDCATAWNTRPVAGYVGLRVNTTCALLWPLCDATWDRRPTTSSLLKKVLFTAKRVWPSLQWTQFLISYQHLVDK